MSCRGIALAFLCLAMPLMWPQTSLAQASDAARAEIIRMLFAEEAAARVDMPFGGEGVELTSLGQIDDKKLNKEIAKHGKSVQTGRIVRLTKIEFGSKAIDIELDGGGKDKKGILDNLQVSVGGGGRTVSQPTSSKAKANGSRISLQFPNKVPANLTSDKLKELLAPVLDFAKQTIASASIETLPPEFQEAVRTKEARIGMDEETVLLAMGRPERRTSEKVGGVEQETWLYRQGIQRTFVTFEKSVVVSVTVHSGN